MKLNLTLSVILFFTCCNHKSPTIPNTTGNHSQSSIQANDFLVQFNDSTTDGYGYKNANGGIVIPIGKYSMCFTDTFKTYAIVVKPNMGFIGIDRQENILYEVFAFDNGPDEESNGLFRIMENDKVGYANAVTGAIAIKPQFKCARPFEDGVAEVSMDCKTKLEGEHSVCIGGNWFYIDTMGKKVKKQE